LVRQLLWRIDMASYGASGDRGFLLGMPDGCDGKGHKLVIVRSANKNQAATAN
jgi:hypothetical protein